MENNLGARPHQAAAAGTAAAAAAPAVGAVGTSAAADAPDPRVVPLLAAYHYVSDAEYERLHAAVSASRFNLQTVTWGNGEHGILRLEPRSRGDSRLTTTDSGTRVKKTVITKSCFLKKVNAACAQNVCFHCNAAGAHLRPCRDCGLVKYCNMNCCTLGWPAHKAACRTQTDFIAMISGLGN